MPQVNSAGTYTKTSQGFSGLSGTNTKRVLKFSGASVSATIEYAKPDGTFAAYSNGGVSAVPTEVTVNDGAELRLVVTGTPDFFLTVSNAV